MKGNEIKILLIDDHAIVRNGIKALLSSESDISIVGEAGDGDEAVEAVKRCNPDILIMDINMPNLNGLDAIKEIKSNGLEVKTLVLSMHESEDYVLKALDVGAQGYVLKDTSKEHFLKAIHTIYNGGKYFSGSVSEYLVQRLLDNDFKSKTKDGIANNGDQNAEVFVNLTKREKQILEYVVTGLSNKEIADELNKSVRTIEAHRFNLMKKLDAKNLADLMQKSKYIK